MPFWILRPIGMWVQAAMSAARSGGIPLRPLRAAAAHQGRRGDTEGAEALQLIISDACLGLVESAAEIYPLMRAISMPRACMGVRHFTTARVARRPAHHGACSVDQQAP